MNIAVRVIATALTALACLMAGTGIATAHTALTGSDPVENATVASAPSTVTLTFSEDINANFANVALNSADGRNWIDGSARVDGPRLTASVGADLPGNGVYTVAYRVVSADGHPVTGSYTFTLAGAPSAPTSSTASAATSTSSPAAAPSDSTASGGSNTASWIGIAAVAGLALGGVIAFRQSRRRKQDAAASGH